MSETLTVEDTRDIMLEWAAVSVPDDGFDGVRLAVCLVDESCKAGGLPGVWKAAEPDNIVALRAEIADLKTERKEALAFKTEAERTRDAKWAEAKELRTERDELKATLGAAPFEMADLETENAKLKAVVEAAECSRCHNKATCYGEYEGHGGTQLACDTCCGHGNEDGWCKPIAALDDSGGKP